MSETPQEVSSESAPPITVLPQQDVHEALLARVNTDDFADRHTYVGASEVGDCMRIVAWKKLHVERTRIKDPNAAGRIYAGKVMENAIVQLVRDSLKGLVRETGHNQQELVHPTAPLRSHPDGRLRWDVVLQPGQKIVYLDEKAQLQERTEPLEGLGALEVKTAGHVFRKYLKEGLPQRYIDQSTVEMGLGGTKWTLLVLVNRENFANFVTFLLFFDQERYDALTGRSVAIIQAVDAIRSDMANGENQDASEAKHLPPPEEERGFCAYCALRDNCPAFALSKFDLKEVKEFPEDMAPEVEVKVQEYVELKPIASRAEALGKWIKEAMIEHKVPAAYGVFLRESDGKSSLDSKAFEAGAPEAFKTYKSFFKKGAKTLSLIIARKTGEQSAEDAQE